MQPAAPHTHRLAAWRMWRYSRSTCWSTILMLGATTCLPSLLGGLLLLLLCLIESAVTVPEGLHFCKSTHCKATSSKGHAATLSRGLHLFDRHASLWSCLPGTPPAGHTPFRTPVHAAAAVLKPYSASPRVTMPPVDLSADQSNPLRSSACAYTSASVEYCRNKDANAQQ